MGDDKWHRHVGVYGICKMEGKILVVHKTAGPYRNRYDLPGGTIEPNESVDQALTREFKEETGLEIVASKALGFSEFIVRYTLGDHSHVQHIPLFFQVECKTENNGTALAYSNDTEGYEWVLLRDINEENSSPLVMKAKDVIAHAAFTYESKRLDDWVTREG